MNMIVTKKIKYPPHIGKNHCWVVFNLVENLQFKIKKKIKIVLFLILVSHINGTGNLVPI